MPDRYLLEDGSGYYLLEDGTSFYLREEPVTTVTLAKGSYTFTGKAASFVRGYNISLEGAKAWTPATLGTDVIEYDARVGVTNVSGKASQWDDNIGSVDAVQATAGARPTIGTNVLTFPAGTSLSAAMPQPNFLEGCYAVCRLNSYTGRGVLLGAQSGGRIFYLTGASTDQLTIAVDRQSFVGGPSQTVTVPDTSAPYIIGIGATWPAQELSFNGTVYNPTPTGDAGFNVFDTTVGGGGYENTVDFHLHHLVRTPAKLDTTNRQILEGFFAHTWDAVLGGTALRDGLYSGHPYKSVPPGTGYTFKGREMFPIRGRPLLLGKGSYTFTGKDAGFYFLQKYAAPASDISIGGWTNEAGGTTLYTSVDETVANDADYIKSAVAPANDIAVLGVPITGAAEPFKVRYRISALDASSHIGLIVRLKQGASIIATWEHVNIPLMPVTIEQTLTSPQFSTITDFSNLRVEIQANSEFWTPSLINMTGRWDVSDINTLTIDGSINVQQINDKSGNGLHLVQATSGSRPAYLSASKQIVGAIGKSLTVASFPIAGATPRLVVGIARRPSAFSDSMLLHWGSTTTNQWFGLKPRDNALAKPVITGWGGGDLTLNDTPAPADTPFIMSGYYDGTTEGGNINGSTPTTGARSLNTGNGSASTLTIGLFGTSPCSWHEVIIYSEYSVRLQQLLEGYLAWKWGAVSSLDGSHPYKLRPPNPSD